MRRIAVVTTICPYPKNVGKNVIWGGIIDYLMAYAGAEIRIFSFAAFASDFEVPVTLLPRPAISEVFANLIWYVGVRRRMSIQEAFFWSRKAHNLLLVDLEDFKPDIVIFDTVRTEQYAVGFKRCGALIYTYLDDLFSVRYARVLAASKNGHSADKYALGNFAERLPGFMRVAFDRSSFLRRVILKFEMRALEKSERRACQSSDLSLLISPAEVEIAQGRNPGRAIQEVPPRMKGHIYFDRRWAGNADFVFLGSLNLAHNITAIEWFLEECLPMVVKASPSSVIRIVGAGGSEKINQLKALYPQNVVQLGFVQDLDEELLKSCCLISPLLFGTGIKIKVIDALRCGLPIVSSTIGAEGIHGVASGAITIADSASEFSAAMLRMVDTVENMKASSAARSVFEKFYSEISTQKRYSEIFNLT